MVDYLVQVIQYNVYEFGNHTSWYKQDLYTYALLNTVELLKRLAAYCAPYQYNSLMQILIALLQTNCLVEYRKIDELVNCFCKYIPEYKKAEYLNDFVKLPIEERYIHGKEYQVEILNILNHNENTRNFFRNAMIEDNVVDDLIKRHCVSEFERRTIIERLMMLYEFDKLNSRQKKVFTEILWENISEEKGLPELPNRYMFAVLSLPHPDGVDILERVKGNLLNSDWAQKLDKNGYSMFMGNVVYFHEIIGLCKYCKKNNIICWTKEEATILISSLLSYIKTKQDKLKLEQETDWSISREFEKRFEKIQEVIVEVLRVTDDIDMELKENINSTFREIYGDSLVWIYLRGALSLDETHLLQQAVLDALYSGENITMAMKATEYILLNHVFENEQLHDFLLQVLRLVRVGREKGLASLLIILHNVFYSSDIEFSQSELYEIDEILLSVDSQYRYNKCSTEEMAKSYVLVRMCCAKLAYEVHNYFLKHNMSELPGTMLWKKICEGQEFAEVKNSWVD